MSQPFHFASNQHQQNQPKSPKKQETSRGSTLAKQAIFLSGNPTPRLKSSGFLFGRGDDDESDDESGDESPDEYFDSMDDGMPRLSFPYKPKKVSKFKKGITKQIVQEQVKEAIKKVGAVHGHDCKIVLLCDNAPIHVDLFNGGNDADVTAFMAPYSPEMNPPEGVFNTVKWSLARDIDTFGDNDLNWPAWVANHIMAVTAGMSTEAIFARMFELIDLYVKNKGALNLASSEYRQNGLQSSSPVPKSP